MRCGRTPPILPAVKQLRERLEELHRELADTQSVDPGSRELLGEVLDDIRHILEREGAGVSEDRGPSDAEPPLAERLREAAHHFEDSHPNLFTAVGRVVDTLSRLGI